MLTTQWWMGAALAAVAAVALWAGWWLWWRFPRLQINRLTPRIRDAKARADVEDNYRKTVGQLLGGAAVLLGAGLAYYQTQRTFKASDVQSQRTSQASHDLLVSQQVTKGFELFGEKSNSVKRLGGLYALEYVMNDVANDHSGNVVSAHPGPYHQPILEALCAYLRDGTQSDTSGRPPATDIQAALTVIARRHAEAGDVIDLQGVHIPNATLSHLNLSGANLSGANLSGINVPGAVLSRVALSGADLSGAHLPGADLDHANLTNANLFAATLSGADLTGANLFASKLYGANLAGAKGADASLNGADLTGANLVGVDLTNADLTNATMINANLTGANLNGTKLTGANLTGAALVQT